MGLAGPRRADRCSRRPRGLVGIARAPRGARRRAPALGRRRGQDRAPAGLTAPRHRRVGSPVPKREPWPWRVDRVGAPLGGCEPRSFHRRNQSGRPEVLSAPLLLPQSGSRRTCSRGSLHVRRRPAAGADARQGQVDERYGGGRRNLPGRSPIRRGFRGPRRERAWDTCGWAQAQWQYAMSPSPRGELLALYIERAPVKGATTALLGRRRRQP